MPIHPLVAAMLLIIGGCAVFAIALAARENRSRPRGRITTFSIHAPPRPERRIKK